ncbi:hypothetical protein GOARA_088_00040 [Gordonia araii NBRC 100433]|uniref:DUF4229 domain-containing protein n=1 Tax=Gordonia araii NBRC 100433 TaxID=1073574 RepID=G7H7B6_9ACTN|nr:hypothetical protein GOARA_088_00040 [Gordonia araii NBRC 100433]
MSDVSEEDTTDDRADEGASEAPQAPSGLGGLLGAIAAYVGARLVLVVILAAAIMGIGELAGQTVPLIVAAAFGVLIALPLGLLLFKSLRRNVNTRIEAYEEERSRRRQELQGRLREPGR